MKTRKFGVIIGALFFILTSLSCSKSDSPQPADTRTSAEVEADFQALNLTAGTHDFAILSKVSNEWNFRLIVPESASATNKRPLIVNLHGASGGDANAHKTTSCYAEPGFASLDPIILSPNAGAQLWISTRNQEMVLTLIELSVKYLPVDTSKIVVTGYSNGGNGAWFFSETQPSIFSAGIPMASSYNTFGTDGNARKINTPLYEIHGENDEHFPLEETQAWIEATNNAGSNVTLKVAEGLTHNEPCEYVPYVKNAVDWLVNEIW
ncbi:MAG: dienelactone hydrolase family protein [Christiangramia sp.]|uniref:carboxylesterase family protein n=1 Tax=Christiangramia sp. TaxID=1931228 RepID=UPI003242A530